MATTHADRGHIYIHIHACDVDMEFEECLAVRQTYSGSSLVRSGYNRSFITHIILCHNILCHIIFCQIILCHMILSYYAKKVSMGVFCLISPDKIHYIFSKQFSICII